METLGHDASGFRARGSFDAGEQPGGDRLERLIQTALAPVTGTSRGYYLWVAFLLMVIAWGIYAYSRQLQDGLIVTGMRDSISWEIGRASCRERG